MLTWKQMMKSKMKRRVKQKEDWMYFQKIWAVFVTFINRVALTLYLASRNLSFLLSKKQPIRPVPHTANYWYEDQERECFWKCFRKHNVLYKKACSYSLTEHSSRRHRFSVKPERHLGENDSHDARQIRLNHKIPNFSFQVEMSCHYGIFT